MAGERAPQMVEDPRASQMMEDLRASQMVEDLRASQMMEDLRASQMVEVQVLQAAEELDSKLQAAEALLEST